MEHIEFSSEYIIHHSQSHILIGAYGWIVTGEQTVHNNVKQVFRIERFVEKLDSLIAGKLYKNGSLWNTMIMISTAKNFSHCSKYSRRPCIRHFGIYAAFSDHLLKHPL
jgi:mannose-1-phosphate guanylyltransferase